MPYIKAHLKNWDIYNEHFQEAVQKISTVEDAQILIEEEAIYTLQVLVVTEINPSSQ